MVSCKAAYRPLPPASPPQQQQQEQPGLIVYSCTASCMLCNRTSHPVGLNRVVVQVVVTFAAFVTQSAPCAPRGRLQKGLVHVAIRTWVIQ